MLRRVQDTKVLSGFVVDGDHVADAVLALAVCDVHKDELDRGTGVIVHFVERDVLAVRLAMPNDEIWNLSFDLQCNAWVVKKKRWVVHVFPVVIVEIEIVGIN